MPSRTPYQNPWILQEALVFACRFVADNAQYATETLLSGQMWDQEDVQLIEWRYRDLEQALNAPHLISIFDYLLDHQIKDKRAFFTASLSASISPSLSPSASPSPENQEEI